MKRILSILITAVLALSCLMAFADAEPLTRNEMNAWREQLLKDSLEDGRYTAEDAGAGQYTLAFDWYTLTADTQRLSSATRILGVTYDLVPEEDAVTPADIRGLRPGDPVEKLLAAWPNENESLAGTREEAVLYQTGSLPGQASAGVLKRNGQRAESVVYSLYQMTTNGVSLSKVTYTLTGGFIDTIEISFDGEMLTLADAQDELAAILDVQAATEFSAFLSNGESMEAEVFNLDDLSFSGIDFMTVTPDDLTALLGDEYAEEWAEDGDKRIRVMEWHALTAVFTYDAQEQLIGIDNLSMNEDLLTGPRDLTVGDTLDVVLNRFRYEVTDPDGIHTWLYGTADSGEYGVMDSPYPGQAEVHYVLTAEGQRVEMILDVQEGALRTITLQKE